MLLTIIYRFIICVQTMIFFLAIAIFSENPHWQIIVIAIVSCGVLEFVFKAPIRDRM